MRVMLLTLTMALVLLIAACAPSTFAQDAPTPTLTPLPIPTTAPTATPTLIPTATATLAPKQIVKVEAFDDFFRPEKITVPVGAQVTWTNVGEKKHTVTLGTLFDVDIRVGESFSYVFDKPGTYQYYCVIHSLSETDGMVGTVVVQ